MPKKITITKDSMMRSSGVQIEYTPSTNRLWIGGFYDSCVGIEGEGFALSDFFKALEIPAKNIRKALEEIK